MAPTPLFLLAASPLAAPVTAVAHEPTAAPVVHVGSSDALPLGLFDAEPSEFESATLEAVLGPLASQSAARRRNRSFAWGPEFVLTFSAYLVDGDYKTFNGQDADEDSTFALDFVIYNWDDDLGVGLEFGMMYGTYSVPTTEAFGSDDDVDVFRGMIGVRVADRGDDDPIYIPFVRAGGIYRFDDGGKSTGTSLEVIRGSDQDGLGWYAGGGIDFRLGSHVAITPSVIYTDVAAANAKDLLFGLQLSVGF